MIASIQHTNINSINSLNSSSCIRNDYRELVDAILSKDYQLLSQLLNDGLNPNLTMKLELDQLTTLVIHYGAENPVSMLNI